MSPQIGLGDFDADIGVIEIADIAGVLEMVQQPGAVHDPPL